MMLMAVFFNKEKIVAHEVNSRPSKIEAPDRIRAHRIFARAQ